MKELRSFNPKYCVNCGTDLLDLDRSPNGDANCVCAKCRAEEKHDFDVEPGVVFDRAGRRVEVVPKRVKVTIEAESTAVQRLVNGWRNKDPEFMSLLKELGVVNIVMHEELDGICPNCGEKGAHFVPPSFGDQGHYICERKA